MMNVGGELGGIDLARNASRADRDEKYHEPDRRAQPLRRDGAVVGRQRAIQLFGREADDRAWHWLATRYWTLRNSVGRACAHPTEMLAALGRALLLAQLIDELDHVHDRLVG